MLPALDSGQSSSFNPCCIGLAIAAADQKISEAVLAGFNPCCIGLAIAANKRRKMR